MQEYDENNGRYGKSGSGSFDDSNSCLMNRKSQVRFLKQKSVLSYSFGKHVYQGEFTISGKHKSGGHSYSAYQKMKKDGKVIVDFVTSNGVIFAHIPESRYGAQRRKGNHTFFPESWKNSQISRAANWIYCHCGNNDQKDGVYEAVYKKVRIKIVVKNKEIISCYPSSDQEGI